MKRYNGMKVLPNANCNCFLYMANRPAGMSASEHFAAALLQYLKDRGDIPLDCEVAVDDNFVVADKWEDEIRKYNGQKHGSEEQGSDSQPQHEPETQHEMITKRQHGAVNKYLGHDGDQRLTEVTQKYTTENNNINGEIVDSQ